MKDLDSQKAFEEGRRAWPTVTLEATLFHEHCLRAVGQQDDSAWGHFATDLYLSAACSVGNREAIRLLNTHYIPRAIKSIARLDPCPAFVDDTLQSLRDKLLVGPNPKIKNYGARGALGAWLSVAASRLALDRIRARNGKGQQLKELPEYLSAPHANPLNNVIRSRYAPEFQAALKNALTLLTARDRNVLRLHLVSRCNIDQIGEIYHVHRTTAARWLRASREFIFDSVRRTIQCEHRLTDSEFLSIANQVKSQLDLGITKNFKTQEPAELSELTSQ